MNRWEKALVSPDKTIREAIQTIDEGAIQIALVVDHQNKLLGTVTDGDIRRGILKGVSLSDSVRQIMNPHPIVAGAEDGREKILETMKQTRLHQIPVVDTRGHLVSVEILDELLKVRNRDNAVLLMAGGLGSRLRPLTDECPKPLLKVGSKPLLEIILENFLEYGFRKFYLSVNYKAEMVQEYFGDGSRWGADIQYIHEDRRLGTAGALSLLPERPTLPLIVMNGDLLTKVNFQQLLDFHAEHGAKATMCVREYDFQVPYGVVRIDHHRIVNIDEKPIQRFFVNAGIYVLEPETLDFIPPATFFDMPELFLKLIARQWETSVFPIREYWLDIGHMDDFARANGEFPEIFG